MNYMELMNHFWLMNEEIAFTCTEKALYFALLDLANKFFWEKEELSFSLQYLCLKVNCTKKALLIARKKLEEYGLIEVRRGFKNVRAATICLVDMPNRKKRVAGNKTETAKNSVDGLSVTCDDKNGNKSESGLTPERVTETTTAASTYKRQDKDKNKTRQSSSSSTRFVEPGNAFSEEEEERFCEIFKNYNAICRSLHKTYKLTAARKLAIKRLEKHVKTIDDRQAYFFKAESTPFLSGGSNGWKADFDWILHEGNYIKVMEGRFYEGTRKGVEEKIPEELMGFDDNELISRLCRQGV